MMTVHPHGYLIEHALNRRNCVHGAAGLAATAILSPTAGASPTSLPSHGDPSRAATVRHEVPSDWFETVPGERMRVRISGADTGHALSALESIVAPGTATPLHYHAADEMFLILSGRLRLVCGGTSEGLAAGSSAIVPGGAHHGFVNLSGEPVRMVALFLPGGMDRLFAQLHATPPEQWSHLARRFDTVIVGPPVTG